MDKTTNNVYDTLKQRGFIAQVTHEEEIRHILNNKKISFYIGFDPTADSLHIGHFIQMVVMAHMQKAGHRPIAIIGGGTAMVGDPSGRSDMRQMLTQKEINQNGDNFKYQLSKLVEFGPDKALMINNADWLSELKFIDFLREFGVHFSVNRMLTAECFKSRLEKGLSFFEFSYMLMQSYDFLRLFQDYNCVLQLGGDDQWSNILGGVDLIRRVEGKSAYGMTFNLLTTSEGHKMGKTQKGAVWLDPKKTSPYEFYQYWRNIDDNDVVKCLKLLTFISLDEIEKLSQLKDEEINKAKKILAFEVTKLIHGEREANNAKSSAEALFSKGTNMDYMPSTVITDKELEEGISILDLMLRCKVVTSKSEGRRLINQGGLQLGDNKVKDTELTVNYEDFIDNSLLLRKGKKTYHRVIIDKS